MIGNYAEIIKATHKQYTNLFVKFNLRAESQVFATDICWVFFLTFCRFGEFVHV